MLHVRRTCEHPDLELGIRNDDVRSITTTGGIQACTDLALQGVGRMPLAAAAFTVEHDECTPEVSGERA
jgi:hypothetical protein